MIAPAQEESDLDPLPLALGMGEELAHRGAEPEVVRMARAELLEAAAERVRAVELENGACDLVHMYDDTGRIEHDDPVLARLEDRLRLRLLREDDVDPSALDRDRRLTRERLEELALVERRRGGHAERQHADRAPRRTERDMEPVAARKRLGSPPRRLVVLAHPDGPGAIGRVELRP